MIIVGYQGIGKSTLAGRHNCIDLESGNFWVDGKRIANLFGQLGYGYDGKQYTDLGALKKAMIKLRSRMYLASIENENITVAFPYGLASVRGGASWSDVYAMIEEVFDGYNVEIWRWDRG